MEGKNYYSIYRPIKEKRVNELNFPGSESSLQNIGGPNFSDFAKHLEYEKREDNSAPYEPVDDEEKKEERPKKTKDVATFFLIDSRNRDKNSFPQPTYFTLMPPRVYKNIIRVEMTQIKLLNSFLYFRADKGNTFLPLIETGRSEINRFLGNNLTAAIKIREGTYTIDQLLKELEIQMNKTPIFYDFPDGFNDFTTVFTVNGDLSVNFNRPGDFYYDRLNSKYIEDLDLAGINSYYWGSRYAGLSEYTTDIIKVAYYYPVLYEATLDKDEQRIYPLLNFTVPDNLLLEGETVYSHIIFNCSGLNDRVILHLINANIQLLDQYRIYNSFRYAPVNKYQLQYDTNTLRINILSQGLNTSLINLINETNIKNLEAILNSLGLSSEDYFYLNMRVNRNTVIYNDMYKYIQSQLASYFAIPFGTYASQYFNRLTNIIFIQNGVDALGIRSSYTPDYILEGKNPISSMVNKYSDSPGYWPNFTPITTNSGALGGGFKYSEINPALSMVPYNVFSKNFQFGKKSIDPTTYYLNTNTLNKTLDVLVDIQPARYTVIKFRSSARQTLKIETLPLPYYYRFSDYNKQGLYKGVLDPSKNNIPQLYFNSPHSYVYDLSNNNMDSIKYATSPLTNRFGQAYYETLTQTTPVIVNSQNNYHQYEFRAPYPPGIESGLVVYPLNISFVSMANDSSSLSTLFSGSFQAFLYHDRSAFMADIEKTRRESPLHYIDSKTADSSKSDITFTVSTFASHTYYTIFRSETLACSNIQIKPFVYYTNTNYTQIQTDYVNFSATGNPEDSANSSNLPFVVNYNTDYIRFPVMSTIQGKDPSNPMFNLAVPIGGNTIGYDISGVSDDLTDYMGYTPDLSGFVAGTQYRVDPLSRYTFQSINVFNQEDKSYFGPLSQNRLLSPVTQNPYTFKGASTAQLKIVHWYDDFNIASQTDDNFSTYNVIGIAERSSITEYLPGFPTDQSGNIQFGRGINAIGFMPVDGVYDVKSFSFKSCIYPLEETYLSSEDPNSQIQYIGVFSGLYLSGNIINISSAITVLKFSTVSIYSPSTLSNTPGFGKELGTWYNYIYDPFFKNMSVEGYTAGSNDLLSYTSMYYMVPFDGYGNSLTFSQLTGSLLPYPRSQDVSTGTQFYGKTLTPILGSQKQPVYIIPSTIGNSDPENGPGSGYSDTQSQYELSMPITTPSIGYREYGYLVSGKDTLFPFTTNFYNQAGIIAPFTMGVTSHVSEYGRTLYIANSLTNNLLFSNAERSFSGGIYASSISTFISRNQIGSLSSITRLLSTPSTLQNYSFSGNIDKFSTFLFKAMPGNDVNTTTHSFEVNPSMNNITLWLWGGGGATASGQSDITGGAGGYIKASLDVATLLNTPTRDCPEGISTLYIVVGKGGNRENPGFIPTTGIYHGYEQPRYGGGGTSILVNPDSNMNYITDEISLQGGGFSGIFTGSNLLTATPLLIVGGGGAAGATDLGGPGGIGVAPNPLPVIQYPFVSVNSSAIYYGAALVTSITDLDSNQVINGNTISKTVDGSIVTFWDPTATPYLNPGNYSPTPNTYRVQLNYEGTVSPLKIRYYGSVITDTQNLATGLIMYTSANKAEMLYSNTNIQPSDYVALENGVFKQAVFEIIPTGQASTQPLSRTAWIAGGSDTATGAILQYSLDGITWVPVTNLSSAQTILSILYVPTYSSWYASCLFVNGTKGIIRSRDGLSWSSSYTSSLQVNSLASMRIDLVTYIVGTLSDGSFLVSIDGDSWSQEAANKFSTDATRIRFINSALWAIGSGGTELKTSLSGSTWISVPSAGIRGACDIAYGVGRYVLVQESSQAPFNRVILYSSDGSTWSAASDLNILGFSAKSIAFGNETFVACGYSTDGSSYIKYSFDGINWSNSFFSSDADNGRKEVQFLNGSFICVGAARTVSRNANNQPSILRSLDGISWSYSQIGGFNSSSGAYGQCVSYGSITLPPTLSSVYIEIQKSRDTQYNPRIYEIRPYTTSNVLTTPASTLIDGNFETVFGPSLTEARDIFQYPLTFTLSNSPVSSINTLKIYSPIDLTGSFTGVRVSLNSRDETTLYSSQSISQNQFSFSTTPTGIKNLFTITLSPPIKAVSTLLFNFTKLTPGTLQINEIQALNDMNLSMIQYIPSRVNDLDSRGSSESLSNLVNGNLTNSWTSGSVGLGSKIRLQFTLPLVDRINTLHIYNDLYSSSSAQISGLGVYTDLNKAEVLYSNDSIIGRESMGYSLVDVPLYSYGSISSIYMEISRNTSGPVIINEVQFFNTGPLNSGNTTLGYSGGLSNSMQKNVLSLSPYDGGGGGPLGPGSAGSNSYLGGYLIGGSPAEAGIVTYVNSTITVKRNLAGGGGGGYYGGGGGGVQLNLGGAGGGGAGYVYKPAGTSFITVLDYGTANPASNYTSPRSNEHFLLVYSNIIPGLTNSFYGQGARGSVGLGEGSHGLVCLSYESNVTVVPPTSGSAIPSYIDGSKLTLFESPLNYNTDDRSLSLSTFTDSIEMSQYSGFNWVWYSSYLSMTGATLLSTMTSSSSESRVPSTNFPSLPSPVYDVLASQFSSVTTFFGSGRSFITYANAFSITSTIQRAFGLFQSTFVTVPYTASNYVEMTETYCLLDYLQDTTNLLNPHVNRLNSPIDRIFGGVPRFGYWANPFLTNVSYIGFDVGPSLIAPSSLTHIAGSSNQVRALYGLVLEQSLATGIYQMKDIMAYKPTLADATLENLSWLKVTQFNESYHIRNLTNTLQLTKNIPAQPYTIRNGISGRIPLFNYKVYTTPLLVNSNIIQSPIQTINDFEGNQIFLYSFQNILPENTSSIHLTAPAFTSTILQINQTLMTTSSNLPGRSIGTLVSDSSGNTRVEIVNQFGYNSTDTVNYSPFLSYTQDSTYYNSYIADSELQSSNVGKAILDSLGNFYASDNKGSSSFYENICTSKIYQKSFANSNIRYASPKFLLNEYNSLRNNPPYDFLVSKTTNIWHIQGASNISTIYGARLGSPYDYNVTTNFANQVFYPAHKIILTKKSSSANPITETTDLTTYPSYTQTQLFFYKNYSTLANDIQGKFASESKNNFVNMDSNSGYFLNSYIDNISLEKSGPIVNDDSFNYLAIRAYSPSESFRTLLRFYLPERYDFGNVSLEDLTTEISTLRLAQNINPDYKRILTSFQNSFNITKTFGSIGLPGFSGSTIRSINFGDFLTKYNEINSILTSERLILSTINNLLALGQSNLITNDLKNILPPYLASRQRITDPLEFSIPFSTVISSSNRGIDEYGLGYNLGFSLVDTGYNTIHRAQSFFKILDDYIYMKLNPELNMNRLDISRQENFSETRDATSQTQLYNCKLLLNTFGSYATTFIQNPVSFNPPIGKLDKLSFSWYDLTGSIINNAECEWSAAVQIVERVDVVE